MHHPEIFEPYERLIEISICGKTYQVPENNSILRGLQFLDMESISYGDFCWNGECLNCQVSIKNGEKEKAVMACRTNVEEGMEVVRMNDEISFDTRFIENEKLEELILEGLNSGPATPFTKADFEDIKQRGLARVKDKVKR